VTHVINHTLVLGKISPSGVCVCVCGGGGEGSKIQPVGMCRCGDGVYLDNQASQSPDS